jgi:hypothetical protein
MPYGQQSAGRQMVGAPDPIQAQRYATQRAFSPEDLSQPLYDRVNYPAAGSNSISFFATQFGQSVTLNQAGASATKNKTYRDTNMDNGGVVPTKRYTFIGLAINYIPAQQTPTTLLTNTIVDDITRLMNGGYIEFRIVDKPLLYLPLNLVPMSNPISALSTTVTNSCLVGYGANAAIPFPMFKFAIPITLNPYENFRFTMNFDGTITIGQSTDIQVVLHAYMRRPS